MKKGMKGPGADLARRCDMIAALTDDEAVAIVGSTLIAREGVVVSEEELERILAWAVETKQRACFLYAVLSGDAAFEWLNAEDDGPSLKTTKKLLKERR
jgi:hypothetical protein